VTTVTDVLERMLDSWSAKVVADERKSTIIVSGPPKAHERVKQLIEGLDVPEPDATGMTRVYRLQQADPASVGRTLSDLLSDQAMSVGVDQRARSVIISAPAELQQRAAELIEQLDRSVEAEDGNRTEMFMLKYGDSASVAKLLRDVIGEEIPDARILEDDRLNSILLSGSDAAVARAAELIDQLDVPDRQRALRQHQVKVFGLEHADASEMVKMVVNALGPEGSVAADNRTNSILATGPEEELKVIETVLLRLDEEAENHRQAAAPTACQVRIVWLIGPMPDGGITPPAGLKEVVDELAGIGIKDVRQVAHTVVNTHVEGEFRLHCSPALNDESLPLTVSGIVTQREGTPILSVQILAERPVATGTDEGPSGDMRPLVDLETEIAAPYGHFVVLGVAPVEVATSAFVVQIVPGKQ
jgi:hypothetical protein